MISEPSPSHASHVTFLRLEDIEFKDIVVIMYLTNHFTPAAHINVPVGIFGGHSKPQTNWIGFIHGPNCPEYY